LPAESRITRKMQLKRHKQWSRFSKIGRIGVRQISTLITPNGFPLRACSAR
jgi:hypothetical protein